MTSNIKVLQELGTCTEETWPYRPELVDRRPGDEAFVEASRFLLQRARQIPVDLKAMKSCLAEGYPFAFGLLLFKSFDRAGRSGVVPMPDRAGIGRETHGCHAMLAVGYSDREQAFVVRNSWGSRWGDEGYCYIPYAYLANPRMCADCWTIEAVKNLDFTARPVADDGFDVNWDEDWDSAANPYAFDAMEAVHDATALAIAVQRDGIVPERWDGDVDNWDDDWGDDGKTVADNFDRDEDAAPAPFQVTLGCEGLGNPAMVPVVVAMLSTLPGVLGLECDTDAMTATLTLDPNVMTAEKLWTTIEGDATIRPAWIA